MKGLCSISIRAALCLFSVAAAYSQAVNGTIVGTVTDSSGGSIASAKVTLTETNTQIVKFRQSNTSGNFEFPEIPPGTYNVGVEMAGFKKELKTGIIVE